MRRSPHISYLYGEAESGEAKWKLCLKIMFVMIKVFCVPSPIPLPWQFSLRELDANNILSGRHCNGGNKLSNILSALSSSECEGAAGKSASFALPMSMTKPGHVTNLVTAVSTS